MAKKVKIELDYDIGDFVYIVTDPEQFKRQVTEIRLLPGGVAIYNVVLADSDSEHYSIELNDKPDLSINKDED